MSSSACASVRSDVAAGNKSYRSGEYQNALEHYVQAYSKEPKNPKVGNNAGVSFYKMNRYQDAGKYLSEAVASPELSSKNRSIVNYNLGNNYYKSGQYDKAIQAYKTAVDLDNTNQDAKYNLGFVRKKHKDNNQSGVMKEKNNQDSKGDKQDNNQQKKDKKNNQGNDDNNKNDNKKNNEKPPEKGDISKEDAQRILDMVAKEQGQNPTKLQQSAKGETNVEKDW